MSTSSPSFCFKQFEVFHDKCAMKVGMDGVSLGAWAHLPESDQDEFHILDIGTGSGLIALMLAQKYPEARIDAVEKDVAAAIQATENVSRSPWPHTVEVRQGTFPEVMQSYTSPREEYYHLIVCNPPFFKDDLKPINKARSLARHAEDLCFGNLVQGSARLLHAQGLLSVILPSECEEIFEEYCWEYKLYPTEICHLIPVVGKKAKRVLMSFGHERGDVRRSELGIALHDGSYTPDYQSLVSDYYLHM